MDVVLDCVTVVVNYVIIVQEYAIIVEYVTVVGIAVEDFLHVHVKALGNVVGVFANALDRFLLEFYVVAFIENDIYDLNSDKENMLLISIKNYGFICMKDKATLKI